MCVRCLPWSSCSSLSPLGLTLLLLRAVLDQVMNDWVGLSGGGSLHVVVEYDPVGMEPQVRAAVLSSFNTRIFKPVSIERCRISGGPSRKSSAEPCSNLVSVDNAVGPQVNDVVFFEAFARSPRSLVFPVNEPMVVKVRGSMIHCVVERLNHPATIHGPGLCLPTHMRTPT